MKSVKIVGLHYRDTKNIGDRNCHPLDYMEFVSNGCEFIVEKHDVRNIPEDLDADVIIFGGGAIAEHGPKVAKRFPNALKIAWGIGFTTGKKTTMGDSIHDSFSENFQLYGTRDYNTGSEFAPCTSCMSNLLDIDYTPEHKVVVYGHAGKWPLKEECLRYGFPYMDNTQNKRGLKGAIEHLASGEIIITTSYHGAYWGSMLNRQISMLPFGSKFYNLKNMPPAASTFEEGLAKASLMENIKKDYRSDTLSFASTCCSEISKLCGHKVFINTKSIQDIM